MQNSSLLLTHAAETTAIPGMITGFRPKRSYAQPTGMNSGASIALDTDIHAPIWSVERPISAPIIGTATARDIRTSVSKDAATPAVRKRLECSCSVWSIVGAGLMSTFFFFFLGFCFESSACCAAFDPTKTVDSAARASATASTANTAP